MTNGENNRRWLEEFRNGDREAWKHYYLLHYWRIYYYLRKRIGNSTVAKDQTQDAFLVLWDKRQTIVNEEQLVASLYATAKNLAREFIREHGRLEELKAYMAEQQRIELATGSEQREGEIVMALRKEVGKLTARKRRIIVLYYFHGKTSREIAIRLGIKRQTVLNHLSQSIVLLRKGLDGRWEEINPDFS
jgi:RNA polymerase sigma-70 factor (ECF subfamily)